MSPRPGGQPYALAVSVRPEDASTTLFFGHLAGGMRGTLRVAHYRQPDLAEQLSGASAIILVRALFELDPVIWFARLAGVPLYYFVDDNFMLLREQPGIWSAYVEPYSARNVRERLRAFSGVLVSSPALLEYFEEHRLHGRLMLFPPVGWSSALPRPSSNGASRIHRFLRRLAPPRCPGGLRAAGHSPGGRRAAAAIRGGRRQRAHRNFAGLDGRPSAIRPVVLARVAYAGRCRRGCPGAPVAPGHANNAYKNPHALISAHAIGAVPVVSARPPYDDLPESGIVLQCEDTIDSWYLALKRALDPVEHAPSATVSGRFARRISTAA